MLDITSLQRTGITVIDNLSVIQMSSAAEAHQRYAQKLNHG